MAGLAYKQWITHVQTPRTEQLLKYAAQSEVISFAGGLPAEELFPSEQLESAFQTVIGDNASEALQYTWSEGCERLREQISEQMAARGVKVSPRQIIVTSGAQQGLDLLAKLFIRNGDPLALESPTYVPAIQVFELYAPQFVPVARCAEGLDLAALGTVVAQRQPRMLYVIPAGHNPTGGVLNASQRADLLKIMSGSSTALIEDAAYADIQYDQPQPPLACVGDAGRVFFLGSFSKVLSPGLRIGWIAGPSDMMQQLALIKQASDLQTSTLNQLVLSKYFEDHTLADQVARCVPFYRERRDAMLKALREHFPAEARWSVPAAGFSFWIELPEGINTEPLLTQAVVKGVAFEPGRPFFPLLPRENFLRLSFSNQTPQKIKEGIARLGEVVKSALTPSACGTEPSPQP